MDVNDAIHSLMEFTKNLDFSEQMNQGFFKDATVLITRGDETIILVGDDANKYTDLKSSIHDAVSQRRPVSKRAVEGIIDDFFMRALGSGDHRQNPSLPELLKVQVQELKTALFERPKNWDVRLIVEGLAPSGLPMTVGHVHFQHLNEASFSELRDRVTEFVKKSDGPNKEAYEARLQSEIDVLRSKSIAVASVTRT